MAVDPEPIPADQIAVRLRRALAETPVVDIHTHLCDPALGPLLLWGIDELVTYHYLIAEVFRVRPDLAYDDFWRLDKRGQADLIWRELFVERTPISEACRGVLTVLQKLGLDANVADLDPIREYFRGRRAADYVDDVFRLAGVARVYMTNDPLDPAEAPQWLRGFDRDNRFLAVLRLDGALMGWPEPAAALRAAGYAADSSLSGRTIAAVRTFLNDWCGRLDARYMAISLPPAFRYPDIDSALTTLMAKAVLPTAAERGIPVAMMIGVKKHVNPALRLAGDGVGKAGIETVERLAADFGQVRFLVTFLARENAHEFCVAARKFKNLLPFGCWWFLNNPSLIREITAMRLETLGVSFIPQHSDARVLDQLIYKWTHARTVIGEVLAEKYADTAAAGRRVTETGLRRDLARFFSLEI